MFLLPYLHGKVASDVTKDYHSAKLVVFKSGDFLILPESAYLNTQGQVFKSDRVHRVGSRAGLHRKKYFLPFHDFNTGFPLFSVLLCWLTFRTWRLNPSTALRFRDALVDNGFNLIYLKDDTYRISRFRLRFTQDVKFVRSIGLVLFSPCSMSKLNHVKHVGFDIYFHEKK